MKKLLSLALAFAMLLSFAVIIAVPVSADDGGDWNVYSNAKEYRDDFDPTEDEYTCVPGYSYVSGEGLKVTPAELTECTPKIGIQTKKKVDLTDGVYMLVRIDAFSFDADDKWFTFSISDTQYVNVGSKDKAKDGERITAMVRPDESGKANLVQWNYSNFLWGAQNTMTYGEDLKYDNKGNILLALSIKYKDGAYTVTVNGAEMPKVATDWMNTHFSGDNSEAYIGINMQNSKKGGTAGCTVLKFGTAESRANVPTGTDKHDPVIYSHTKAPIASPETVEAGMPAVRLNGSRADSDAKSTVKDSGPTKLTEENYLHYTSPTEKVEITFNVKNEVSYDASDFPYILVITRNFCTCGTGDCYAYEDIDMYVMIGETLAAGSACKVVDIACPHLGSTYAKEDGFYNYFLLNLYDEDMVDFPIEGRINGVRFDANLDMVTLGRNEFDICEIDFFASEEDAVAYAEDFIGVEDIVTPDNGNEGGEGNEDNNTETETETDNTPEEETTTPAGDETEETAAPNKPAETEAPAETQAPAAEESGCFGTVGFGAAMIVVASLVAGFVAFKKKEN